MRRRILSMLLIDLYVIGMLTGCSSVPDGAEQATPQAEQETGVQETEMNIPVETVTTDTFEMDYFRFGSGDKVLVIIRPLLEKLTGADPFSGEIKIDCEKTERK